MLLDGARTAPPPGEGQEMQNLMRTVYFYCQQLFMQVGPPGFNRSQDM